MYYSSSSSDEDTDNSTFLQDIQILIHSGFQATRKTQETDVDELSKDLGAIQISPLVQCQDSQGKKINNVQLAQRKIQPFEPDDGRGGGGGRDGGHGGKGLSGGNNGRTYRGGSGRDGGLKFLNPSSIFSSEAECNRHAPRPKNGRGDRNGSGDRSGRDGGLKFLNPSNNFLWEADCNRHAPRPKNGRGDRSGSGDRSGRDGGLKCLNPNCVNNGYYWKAACSCCYAPQPKDCGGRPENGRGGRGDRGASSRYGDWKCLNPDCVTCIFSWSVERNGCHAPRSEDFSRGPLPDGGSTGPSRSGGDKLSRGSPAGMRRDGFGYHRGRQYGQGHGGPMRDGRPGGDRRHRHY